MKNQSEFNSEIVRVVAELTKKCAEMQLQVNQQANTITYLQNRVEQLDRLVFHN